MGFIASFFIALAFAVVGELLRSKQSPPNARASSLDDFDIPTAEEGRSIPAFAGKVKFKGPNVTWYGDLEVQPIKKKIKTGWFSSKTQIVNWRYKLGMQLAIAHGREDVYCHNIFFGENPTPARHTRSDEGDGVTRFLFADDGYYGGDESEGGVAGIIRFYGGTDTQPGNAYFGAQIDEPAPAYRGLCHMILESFYLGTSHYIKAISVELSSYPNQLGLPDGKHKIVDDANPACMIYEIMTQQVWAAGMVPSDIDVEAFRAVGLTLHAEGYGMSMIYNGGTTARSLIEEILRHVDGVLFSDPQTGLVTIRLARKDYDANLIPHYTQDDFGEDGIKFSRPSWTETKNHIKGTYVDRAHDYTEAVIEQQDLSNIIQRGSEVSYEQSDFSGFTRYEPASKAVARTLKTLSYPLAKLSGSLPRRAWKTKPGDVFKVTWPGLGGGVGIAGAVFRAIRVNYGTLSNNKIEIEAVEDIFAISAVAYAEPPPSNWIPPSTVPTPMTRQAIVEAPLFGAPAPERFLIAMGSKTDRTSFGYELWADDTPTADDYTYRDFVGTFTPSALLDEGYGTTGADEDEFGFTVKSMLHLSAVEQGTADSRANGFNLAIIGSEWVAWRNYVDNGDGTYTFKGVWRGVLDTVPQDNAEDTVVWFVTEGAGLVSESGYVSDKTVKVKLLPKTMGRALDLVDATEMTRTTASRALRPFPPGKVRVNGSRPNEIVGAAVSEPFTLTWAHRDPFDALIRSQSADSRRPSAYTPRYDIRVYNADTDALLAQATGADAVSAIVSLVYDGPILVELETVVSGVTSWQKHRFLLNYTPAGTETTNQVIVDSSVYILDGGNASG